MRNCFRLFRYARSQAGWWGLITLLTLTGTVCSTLQPWPMKLLVDSVLGNSPAPQWVSSLAQALGRESRTTLLVLVALAGLAVYALSSVLDGALSLAWTAAGRRMVNQAAQAVFHKLQRRSLAFHKRNSVADLMSRVTMDSWAVYQAMETLLFGPAHALLMLLVMLGLMLRLDWQLALWTLGLVPLMVAASLFFGKRLRAAAESKREVEVSIQAHIQQTLTGIPVVQAFAQEEAASRRFRSLAEAAIRSQQRSALLGSINGLTSGLVATLGSGAVLWLGARHVLGGSLTLGALLVFLVYLNSLQAQIKTLSGVYTGVQGLSASTRRLLEVLEAPEEFPSRAQGRDPGRLAGRICLEGVTTGYEAARPILKQVRLEVEPGEVVGIVGATGAGKTTLVSLIPRLLDPWEGRVLLDGMDLRELQLEKLRGQVGVVLQESFLFPVSIRDNIAYGRPGATEEEIVAAAKAANAHGFIASLPEGYETIIGERSATLSGGQRQLLALARAFLKQPSVLILDEPTSAVDAQTESLVLAAIQKLIRGRTTLIVAHRLSTIRHADRIIVLDRGEILESGPHEELLARNGAYARLCGVQKPGKPKPAAAAV